MFVGAISVDACDPVSCETGRSEVALVREHCLLIYIITGDAMLCGLLPYVCSLELFLMNKTILMFYMFIDEL